MSKTVCGRLMFVAAILCGAAAWCASNERDPHIGYVYPAGGQCGTVVQVLAGGQFLTGTKGIHVTGDGVSGTIVQVARPLTNDQIRDVRRELSILLKRKRATATLADNVDTMNAEAVPLPDHPLLRNVPNMSAAELEYWINLYFNSVKKQMNAQLSELVLLEITVDADAKPGERELRFITPRGLTNPVRFHVGALPEAIEREPNDLLVSEMPAFDVPVLFNGQIMPGDVDRFRFRAQKGQRLVLNAYAQRLMPYLADTVPGWFQAAITLYDAQGKEIGFADHFGFAPDPVLMCEVPETGEYEVEIRDSIYRGREDFVYRVSVGEEASIASTFPSSGEEEEKSALPEVREKEKNNDVRHARKIDIPVMISGRIEAPGDIDVYRFKGGENEEIVAEVYARRFNSPLDSVVRLLDEAGHVVAWNDDCDDKGAGLITHQADSYVRARLPKQGVYYVEMADTQKKGGDEYVYRLRVSPPRPDFALRVIPSSIAFPPTHMAPLTVYALRKDGFTGDIEIQLKDAPAGFALSGGRIPAGCDCVRMTLMAPLRAIAQPIELPVEGYAQIGGQTVSRRAVPAEDMMQAFAYRHLVPSQALLATVPKPRQRVAMEVITPLPVRVPLGGAAEVMVRVPPTRMLDSVQIQLSGPPKGLTVDTMTLGPEVLSFILRAGDGLKVGYADNAIVEASIDPPDQQPQDTKKKRPKQRNFIGVLPAIPFEIVQQ